MMKVNRYRYYLTLAVLLLYFAVAASQSFTVQAPRQVRQGESFQVRYVLKNANGTSASIPPISGLTKLYGPAVSQSSNVQVINGRVSSSSETILTVTYRANTTGRFTVAPASIEADGKRLTTRSTTVEVIPSGQTPQNAVPQADPMPTPPTPTPGAPSNADPMTQSAGKKISNDDFFVKISMSKDEVYEQEAVVCTIKLYSTYQISRFMCTLQPSFNGFLIEELKTPEIHEQRETINGKTYFTAELKKCILYPQESGKLTITSGNYDAQLIQFDTYHTPFGSMSQPVPVDIKIQSNSASVNILPLPEPRPAGFTGAVGVFSLNRSLKPGALKTYSPATYTITVSGTGNIKYVKSPLVQFPKEFDTYDPKTKLNLESNGNNMTGSVDFNYTVIPQYEGKFVIKGGDFVFFNTSTHQYETLHVEDMPVQVAKGEGKPSSHYKLRNRDIAPLHAGEFELSKHRSSDYVNSVGYWLLYLLAMVAAAGAVAIYRKVSRASADNPLTRNRRAGRVAARRLKKAQQFMAANRTAEFYNESLNALWGYMSDKLNIPASQLNRDNIANEMANYGFGQQHVDEATQLLDTLEEAQYAPSAQSESLESVMQRCSALMSTLENVKRDKMTSK